MATTPTRRMRPGIAAARGATAMAEASPAQPAKPPMKSSRPPSITTEERGHGFVSTSVKDRQGTYYEDHKEVEVLKETFSEEDPPAHVRMGAGMTINLDNYESLRIDCAVTIPCHRDRLQEAYEIASAFVADRINDEQVNWLGSAEKSATNTTKGKGR